MVANGESVPATVIKAGSIFEMAPYSALDAAGYTNVDRDFVNLTNSQDRITLRAVNWRGSCHLPMNEVVEGLRKIGVRIRNSAH